MMNRRGEPEPSPDEFPSLYDVPEFYGEHGSIDSMTSIAAPLLAGAAVSITGVVIQQESALRFPGTVLLLLVLTLLLLLTAVQAGFWARRHAVVPEDIEKWYPELSGSRRRALALQDQHRDSADFQLWANRARWCFGLGITLLWAAVATALIPQHGNKEPTIRYIAAGVAYGASVLEVAWLTTALIFPGRFRWLFRARRAGGGE